MLTFIGVLHFPLLIGILSTKAKYPFLKEKFLVLERRYNFLLKMLRFENGKENILNHILQLLKEK
jgi:hypothetical protein